MQKIIFLPAMIAIVLCIGGLAAAEGDIQITLAAPEKTGPFVADQVMIDCQKAGAKIAEVNAYPLVFKDNRIILQVSKGDLPMTLDVYIKRLPNSPVWGFDRIQMTEQGVADCKGVYALHVQRVALVKQKIRLVDMVSRKPLAGFNFAVRNVAVVEPVDIGEEESPESIRADFLRKQINDQVALKTDDNGLAEVSYWSDCACLIYPREVGYDLSAFVKIELDAARTADCAFAKKHLSAVLKLEIKDGDKTVPISMENFAGDQLLLLDAKTGSQIKAIAVNPMLPSAPIYDVPAGKYRLALNYFDKQVMHLKIGGGENLEILATGAQEQIVQIEKREKLTMVQLKLLAANTQKPLSGVAVSVLMFNEMRIFGGKTDEGGKVVVPELWAGEYRVLTTGHLVETVKITKDTAGGSDPVIVKFTSEAP